MPNLPSHPCAWLGVAPIVIATTSRKNFEWLKKLGANVVICSRTVDELEAAAARITEESGKRCLAVPTDVRDPEAVQALADVGRVADLAHLAVHVLHPVRLADKCLVRLCLGGSGDPPSLPRFRAGYRRPRNFARKSMVLPEIHNS